MHEDPSLKDNPDDAGIGNNRDLVQVLGPSELTHETMRAVHSEVMINEILPGLSLHEPTALLLDVNNLFRRAKDNNFKIDYLRLKNIFEQRCSLRYCAAFSAVDREQAGALEWVRLMQRIGYLFVGKGLLRYQSNTGHIVSKGNMDIEITIEALKLSPAFTHVIVGTCDGDFVPLVHELKSSHARKVSVLGISGGNWAGMSRTLAQEADNFYDLSKMQDEVSYRGESRYD